MFVFAEPLLEKPKKKPKTVINAFQNLFAATKKKSPQKENVEKETTETQCKLHHYTLHVIQQ